MSFMTAGGGALGLGPGNRASKGNGDNIARFDSLSYRADREYGEYHEGNTEICFRYVQWWLLLLDSLVCSSDGGAEGLGIFPGLGGNLARMLGFDQLAGVASASILSALVILLVCFLFGLLARWSAAGIVRHWLESSLKRIFPLTTTTRPLLSKLELTDKPARPAVLLRRPGGWQPGILVEEYANGEKVVFVPLSPKTTDGDVYLAGPEDVRPSTLNENTLNVVLLKQGKGLVPSET
jgi:hypothetical protein